MHKCHKISQRKGEGQTPEAALTITAASILLVSGLFSFLFDFGNSQVSLLSQLCLNRDQERRVLNTQTSRQTDRQTDCASQSQGCFLGRKGPSKSGPTEARQDSILAFGEHTLEQARERPDVHH